MPGSLKHRGGEGTPTITVGIVEAWFVILKVALHESTYEDRCPIKVKADVVPSSPWRWDEGVDAELLRRAEQDLGPSRLSFVLVAHVLGGTSRNWRE